MSEDSERPISPNLVPKVNSEYREESRNIRAALPRPNTPEWRSLRKDFESRFRKFTLDDFLIAYTRGRSMAEIKFMFGTSMRVIKNACEYLNLPPKTTESSIGPKIYRAFTGVANTESLSLEFGISQKLVRRLLLKEIDRRWWSSPKKPKYPPPLPERLFEVRIADALDREEYLFDNPDILAKKSGTSQKACIEYLRRCFRWMNKSRNEWLTEYKAKHLQVLNEDKRRSRAQPEGLSQKWLRDKVEEVRKDSNYGKKRLNEDVEDLI